MMNNIGTSGIDIAEVSSIKKLILQKAQEKQDAANQNVQNDAMNEARSSVVSNKPRLFGGLTGVSTSKQEEVKPKAEVQPQKEVPQLKHSVQSVEEEVFINSMRDEVMNSARNQYRKSTLSDALKFLNTQASISLVNKTHSKIV